MISYTLNQGELFKQLHCAGLKRLVYARGRNAANPDPAVNSASLKCFEGVLGMYSAFEVVSTNPGRGMYLADGEPCAHVPGGC